jgi:hypothetical protein
MSRFFIKETFKSNHKKLPGINLRYIEDILPTYLATKYLSISCFFLIEVRGTFVVWKTLGYDVWSCVAEDSPVVFKIACTVISTKRRNVRSCETIGHNGVYGRNRVSVTFSLYHHSDSWHRIITNTCMRKFGLYWQRSLIQ